MTKLSELDWDEIQFGLRVRSANYLSPEVIGVITRITHGGWVEIHWSNGQRSFWPKYYYKNEVIDA